MIDKKAKLGGVAAVVLVGLCILLLNKLQIERTGSLTKIGGEGVLITLFVFICLYAMSLQLWRSFSGEFGFSRSYADGLIDMGMLAIGKYIPGKIWGIVARGSIEKGSLTFSKFRASVSTMEQVYLLWVGFVLVCACYMLTQHGTLKTLLLNLGLVVLLCNLSLLLAWRVIDRVQGKGQEHFLKIDVDVVLRALALSVGYISLWLLTVLSFAIVVKYSGDFMLEEILALSTAFLVSMIAGWLAFFSPAGLGVREAVFVSLMPESFTWGDGLSLIVLHRTLQTIVDIKFGTFAACLLWYQSRMNCK